MALLPSNERRGGVQAQAECAPAASVASSASSDTAASALNRPAQRRGSMFRLVRPLEALQASRSSNPRMHECAKLVRGVLPLDWWVVAILIAAQCSFAEVKQPMQS